MKSDISLAKTVDFKAKVCYNKNDKNRRFGILKKILIYMKEFRRECVIAPLFKVDLGSAYAL